jgi:hypothetical protein
MEDASHRVHTFKVVFLLWQARKKAKTNAYTLKMKLGKM